MIFCGAPSETVHHCRRSIFIATVKTLLSSCTSSYATDLGVFALLYFPSLYIVFIFIFSITRFCLLMFLLVLGLFCHAVNINYSYFVSCLKPYSLLLYHARYGTTIFYLSFPNQRALSCMIPILCFVRSIQMTYQYYS